MSRTVASLRVRHAALSVLAALLALAADQGALCIDDPWREKMAFVSHQIKSLGIPYDYETCVRREAPQKSYAKQKADLGIVVVWCDENLRMYAKIGCRAGTIQYYIYSKCGKNVTEFEAVAAELAECSFFKESVSTVYTDLSWSKAHSEYLEHVITRYDRLEDNLLFNKAKSAKSNIRDVVDISGAVDIALTGKWAYKPLWPTKFSVRFSECPMECNAAQFGRELCALYKRYTCESDCYSCPWDNEWVDVPRLVEESRMQISRCFFPNPRSSFITTADRLRALPVTEYMWLREWIQSWAEGTGGIFRRLLGERLWPVLLGCPEDIHHNTSDGGCASEMQFPSGFRALPPDEMIQDGLVRVPTAHPPQNYIDLERHSGSNFDFHVSSPNHVTNRTITFAVHFSHSELMAVGFIKALKALVASALQFHPSSNFFLLVSADHVIETSSRLSPHATWFADRLQIHVVHKNNPGNSTVDVAVVSWQELAANFLSRHILRHASPGKHFGHVIFLSVNTLVLDTLRQLLDDYDFSVAIPARPTGLDISVEPRMMFLHKDHLQSVGRFIAVHLMDASAREVTLEKYLNELLSECVKRKSTSWLQDRENRYYDCGVFSARLLDCRLWASMYHARTENATLLEESTESCSFGLDNTKIVSLRPLDGDLAWKVVEKMREYAEPLSGRQYLNEL